MPSSGMPSTRPSALPTLQKCGTKRVHSLEISTLQSVWIIHLLTEAMMSGSAWEARMYSSFLGEK